MLERIPRLAQRCERDDENSASFMRSDRRDDHLRCSGAAMARAWAGDGRSVTRNMCLDSCKRVLARGKKPAQIVRRGLRICLVQIFGYGPSEEEVARVYDEGFRRFAGLSPDGQARS